MADTCKQILDNENGFVLVVALLMLAVVTVMGIAVTQISNTEMLIATNDRSIADDFYVAEGGLIDISERSTTWLTNNFLTTGESAAKQIYNIDIDTPPTGKTSIINPNSDDPVDQARADTLIEIRCITAPEVNIGGLSTAANDVPVARHINPPPVGSGYSVKYFEVRRYGLTSTSIKGDTRLQMGVWKLFNKY